MNARLLFRIAVPTTILATLAISGACGGAPKGAVAYGPHGEGDVRAWLPDECDNGRGYVSFARMRESPELLAMLRDIDTQLPTTKLGAGMREALDSFRAAGFVPWRDVDELATCEQRSGGKRFYALATAPSVRDPLGVLVGAVPELKRVDAVHAESRGDVAIGVVGGRVLLVARPSSLLEGLMASTATRGPSWNVEDDVIGLYSLREGHMSAVARIRIKGADLVLDGTLDVHGGAEKKLEETVAEAREGLAKIGKKLEERGLPELASAVVSTRIELAGRRITVSGRMPIRVITAAFPKIDQVLE